MPTSRLSPPRSLAALVMALAIGAVAATGPAVVRAQEPPEGGSVSTSTTTTVAGSIVSVPDGAGTTTTTVPPGADDPGTDEGVSEEPVPVVPDTVPPRQGDSGVDQAAVSRIVRLQLRDAQRAATRTSRAFRDAKQRVVDLESHLDELEAAVAGLAATDRVAVRRVEIARRQFEARAANAVVRGGVNDFSRYVTTDDPNELAVAQTLLDSVLASDQVAVAEYLAAKADVDAGLVRTAERLVDARLELQVARAEMVDARRLDVAARLALAVFEAGSQIFIHGFHFPVGDPHSFWDSFGAPRMSGTEYEHAHQGTDIMAPSGTPLFAAERGIVTKMGSDVLGGTKIWVKGESGTYYYYAHLSRFAEGMVNGLLVEGGTVIGYVGDTGNARGGAPHLHFEIHPDGGPAVNPYPLLKVVDDQMKRSRPEAD